ncbi:MAG: hypothetical protein HZC05_00900 [Candidatus Magasanikbacteria bacterium]|nr:hypothetical protein [Candidatus Magasanikbacteria bacterium]
MKKKLFTLFAIIFLLLPMSVGAVDNLKSALSGAGTVAGKAGVEKVKTPEVYATGIISGALAVLGIVFLILMVYGGFLWMTAKGDETQATKAKDTITMAVIGLMITIASYAATQFIIKYIVVQ